VKLKNASEAWHSYLIASLNIAISLASLKHFIAHLCKSHTLIVDFFILTC